MDKKVFKHAKKFITQVKGEICIDTIRAFLNRKGYMVIPYNNEEGNFIIEQYDLLEYSQKVESFTFCKYGYKFVFVQDTLTDTEKLYTLLHEVGHIVLGHLKIEKFPQSDQLDDIEAYAFTYAVLAYRPKYFIYSTILISLAIILSSLIIAFRRAF